MRQKRVLQIGIHLLGIIMSVIGALILWKGLTNPNTVTVFDLLFDHYRELILGIVIYYIGQGINVSLYYYLHKLKSVDGGSERYSKIIFTQLMLFEITLFIVVTLVLISYFIATFF